MFVKAKKNLQDIIAVVFTWRLAHCRRCPVRMMLILTILVSCNLFDMNTVNYIDGN